MQVTGAPPPLPPAALTDAVTKVIPQVQAQAIAPQTRRAIDPSGKGERGNAARSNKDRAKAGAKPGEGQGGEGPGGSVNFSV